MAVFIDCLSLSLSVSLSQSLTILVLLRSADLSPRQRLHLCSRHRHCLRFSVVNCVDVLLHMILATKFADRAVALAALVRAALARVLSLGSRQIPCELKKQLIGAFGAFLLTFLIPSSVTNLYPSGSDSMSSHFTSGPGLMPSPTLAAKPVQSNTLTRSLPK